MQQLADQGILGAQNIINRMIGYVPELHKIWTGTSDQQLMALCQEFPEFYRYARLMEEAAAAEQKKASRPYDGLARFSEEHTQLASKLLATAATLERGYAAFRGSGKLEIFHKQFIELRQLHQQWLSDLDSFKQSLRAGGAEPKTLEYVDEIFGRMRDRIAQLAG